MISELDRGFRKIMGYPLTWTCSICGKWRPDDKISVYTTPIIDKELGNIGEQNTRYCNDNQKCIDEAHLKNNFRGKYE